MADDDQYQQILTMAGKDSYAKSGAPIFGVSGFDASAMESYILQDASASEQQARAALSERENEKAALLASRALSLRQLLNGPESLEAASILNRSLARLNSQDGLFFFPESLNLGQDPADALLLYSERIRGLYEAGQIQAGNELSREFSEKYPELAGDMVGRLRNYLSLAILESSPSPATALKEARLSPDGLESYLQGPILPLARDVAVILRQSIRKAKVLVWRQPLSRYLLMIILRSFPLPGYERRCKLVILSRQQ